MPAAQDVAPVYFTLLRAVRRRRACSPGSPRCRARTAGTRWPAALVADRPLRRRSSPSPSRSCCDDDRGRAAPTGSPQWEEANADALDPGPRHDRWTELERLDTAGIAALSVALRSLRARTWQRPGRCGPCRVASRSARTLRAARSPTCVRERTGLSVAGRGVAAPARRGLAAALRPVLRRPRALAAARTTVRPGSRARTCARSPGRWCSSRTRSGIRAERGRRAQIDTAYDERRIVRERDPEWTDDDIPVREEAIPVVRRRAADRGPDPAHQPGRGADAQPAGADLPSAADDLSRMIAAGDLPERGRADRARAAARRASATGSSASTPTASSTYASPNALSAFHRHRLPRRGRGASRWPRSSPPLLRDGYGVDESLPLVVTRPGAVAQPRSRPNGTTLSLRAIPIVHDGGSASARSCCCRDVSELRRREQRADDQGRDDPRDPPPGEEQPADGRGAAAAAGAAHRRRGGRARRCDEAVRRVGAIALVHETLSRAWTRRVDFDDVADRALPC